MAKPKRHGRVARQVEAGSSRERADSSKHTQLGLGEYRLVNDHDAFLAPQALSRARATHASTSSA